MSAPLADHVAKKAAKRAPMRIPKRRDPRRFQAYTVAKLLEEYRDPRAILLEIASTSTAALAKEMNASLADALAERRLCAQAVLPFVAQKLPVQVDLRQTRAIVLNMVTETQYEELVTLDAEQTADDDGSFSIALMPNAQTPAHSAEPAGEATERVAQGEQTPEPQHTQTQVQGDGTPVTPPVAGEPPGSLKSADAGWDSLATGRRQRLEDKPAGDAPDRWQKSDHGTWAPNRRKQDKDDG
jgi:hypothetical protein